MKTQKFIFTLLLSFLLTGFVFNCSKDDDSGPEIADNSNCGITGSIDAELVGTWTGEIYFNSDNNSYSQTTRINSNGTFSGSGPGLVDIEGCWRASGDNINYRGTFRYNGSMVTASFSGRVITPDSIYGTHTATNGESGTIWMTR